MSRRGLMVKAALLGWNDEEIAKYTEARIFGLPEVDPEVAVPEARAFASAVRRERALLRGAA